MPPTGKLDADSIGALTEWIREGARLAGEFDLRRRSFRDADRFCQAGRALVVPAHCDPAVVPRVAEAAWPRNPVDVFLARATGCRLRTRGSRGSPHTLAACHVRSDRLPPTIDEINAFLADDSPLAYENVVDRLLASPHYGVPLGPALARSRAVCRNVRTRIRLPDSGSVAVSRLSRPRI